VPGPWCPAPSLPALPGGPWCPAAPRPHNRPDPDNRNVRPGARPLPVVFFPSGVVPARRPLPDARPPPVVSLPSGVVVNLFFLTSSDYVVYLT
jgi:hypothetical protein